MSSNPFTDIFKLYAGSTHPLDELEVKFGTKNIEKISRVDFDNVIQVLKSKGFSAEIPTGKYRLSIQNEYRDIKTARTKISFIRTEITSLSNIRDYCKKNMLNVNQLEKVVFNYKTTKNIFGKRVDSVDFDEFNFRISLKEENILTRQDGRVRGLLDDWINRKKIFRFMKRFTFIHPDYPLKVDCSIVKGSKKRDRYPIPTFTLEESQIFNNVEKYEIEIELFPIHNMDDLDKIIQKTKKVIRFILSGLQKTNYPVSLSERKQILQSYLNLFSHNKSYETIRPSDFIGPSSISLELPNIIPLDVDSTVPNIREPYTITEKADGIRNLLYIHEDDGKIYLINTNMDAQFTGCVSNNAEMYNSLLDGELVSHDKNGKFINNYLAFDIYFKNDTDLRSIPFTSIGKKKKSKTRLSELTKLIKNLNLNAFGTGKDEPPLIIKSKKFYGAQGDRKIFPKCKKLFQQINDGLFPYEIDGIIFTPINKGVGFNNDGDAPINRKKTWTSLLKWKPPDLNTVDFLVTTKKTPQGVDFVGNLFENGDNMESLTQIPQYKTLILRVGFDEKKHGYLTPCQDLRDGKFPIKGNYKRNQYKPVPFYPTNPSDPKASFTNVHIELDDYGNNYMLTENNKETFEDNTIVEFRYDPKQPEGWRWIPIRVRYDKTADYRKGLKNYGNAYHVANSVWHSIHHPVTENMLKTGKGIPDELTDESVYYKQSSATNTRGLRNFHNLYVKRKLIFGAAKKGQTLIDLAVGKGGDWPKWIAAHLSFVFGIDVSKDNIENRNDGVCARYLNYYKKKRAMPSALFIEGNSTLNIRNGNAAATSSGKEILQALFGKGPKDPQKLGAGVYKQYGKAKDGFNIVSCQFALHYFFENQGILQNFVRNVSENCKVGGHFIGTCYDGNSIFEALEDKAEGESIAIFQDEKKMWEIQKEYSSDHFDNDETSLGYAINVYQESINKVFREYLVNFDYFTRILENYGFTLITREEALAMKLPSGSGSFEELFDTMEKEIGEKTLKKVNIGSALEMTADEKRISFYNRYFIFKKDKHVDADKILRVMIDESSEDLESDAKASSSIQESIKKPHKKRAKRLKKVININTISDS